MSLSSTICLTGLGAVLFVKSCWLCHETHSFRLLFLDIFVPVCQCARTIICHSKGKIETLFTCVPEYLVALAAKNVYSVPEVLFLK